MVSSQKALVLTGLSALAVAAPSNIGKYTAADLTKYVNLFIGSEGTVPGTSFNGGNVFPGAAIPFGVVKSGIDTTERNASTDANGGYTPDGNVTAISLFHESGTGGAPKYGVVAQMPLTTVDKVDLLQNTTYMQPRIGRDSASVGYYKTNLKNGVTAETSASQHAGIMQYTYPSNGNKYVLVDVSHYLPTQDEVVAEQLYSNGMIETSANGTYSGYGVWRGGWNEGPDYQIYFCGQFNIKPAKAQLFSNANGSTACTTASSIVGGPPGSQNGSRVGALFEFPANARKVKSKVGVSWISVEKACGFVASEIPSYDLQKTVQAAQLTWNTDVLSKITTTDMSNTTRLTMFYSALYHTHLLPSDRTGENPNWESAEPYYDDYYTIWDTFRCLNSLYLLLEPEREEGIVRSLIDIWRHEKFMPDGRSANYNGRVQGGSNADNVLADAYVKGLTGGINWKDGYEAMRTDAEITPPNNNDPEDLTGSTKEGRSALPDWLRYGFVTPTFGRSVSKTVEYSLNDFSLSQVAAGIAPADVAIYRNRSTGWQHIWDHDKSSFNFTGFVTPKYANGTRVPNFDVTSCGNCEWDAFEYEALPWEYSWTVPFDMQTLVAFMGGSAATERRLDIMFTPGLKSGTVGSGGSNGIGQTLFNPGNEPSFATPFLYNYLPGRQHKSVQRSRETVNNYYNTGPSGIPGNSDAGAMDSWMVWNMLGLYPIVTQPIYLLLSPWFSDLSISVGANNATLRVTARGLSDTSFYVQSVKVNGKAWDKSWVSHDDIKNGGSIDFELGSAATSWDTGELPPSPGHVGS